MLSKVLCFIYGYRGTDADTVELAAPSLCAPDYASLYGHADTARVLIEKGACLETVLNLLGLLAQKYEY